MRVQAHQNRFNQCVCVCVCGCGCVVRPCVHVCDHEAVCDVMLAG